MPTTIPRSADELEEMLHDSAKAKDVLKDQGALKDFIVAYADGQRASDPGIEQQVRDQVDAVFADALRKEQIDSINRLNLSTESKPVARSPHYNAKAPGAGADKMFDKWSDYLFNIWSRNTSAESFEAKTKLSALQNALGSTVPSDGGFLIPETLRSELLRVALETALVRPRARVIPMETLSVPFPTVDSTSNASSVHGGIIGYWTEEGGALTDSSPTFGRINLVAKKLTVYSEIPNELFQDSLISLQAFMAQAYPEALSWFEDLAFINGTGVGEPLGFLKATAAVSVTKETGQAADTILYENIVKAYSRMMPSSINRAVWVAHIDTFPQLATMALAVGTGGSAVWMGTNSHDAVGSPPMSILGRPVIFTEKVPTVGDAGDINFVDFGYYLVGDRQSMQADTSTDYKFGNDKTAMRIIERVDGQPWLRTAITPNQGTNTLSPFIKIAARA